MTPLSYNPNLYKIQNVKECAVLCAWVRWDTWAQGCLKEIKTWINQHRKGPRLLSWARGQPAGSEGQQLMGLDGSVHFQVLKYLLMFVC